MFSTLMRRMQEQKMLPQISDTEREALEAGTIWIDGPLFAGTPDFREILAAPYGRLTAEEQAFLDGPCEELCRMTDRYTIGRTRRVPEAVLDFIKKQGFMGLIIPKQYGGREFSWLAVSTVMAKLSPVSSLMSTFVVIPNSLGAGELIKHYGTEEQKVHYLPRLARGEYIPCFGLTEPTAGSDAASLRAEALAFRDRDGGVKLKLNFRKRYITLAPVANLVSLACRVRDPDNLLGHGADPGITVVLIHKGTPGLESGDHHEPIGEAFYNGPLVGHDVVVPADNIVGGAAYVGKGWKMLMEQLAGGRMISLPAGAVGGAKFTAAVTGAYSMVREQFGIPIGRMEGVEEKIGRIAGLTYLLEASRVFGCSAVDAGQQPPVVSAILKAYSTQLSREIVTDGMDVFSGAGVMQGPSNILGRGYAAAPVGITVEGANIMTRTLMIFGQGATRCHPYALKVVQAVSNNDAAAFRRNLLGWSGHFAANVLRGSVRYLTRGASAGSPVGGETARYYRRLAWASTRFAVLTDLAMFTIGGKLKARGKLTGRYADVIAWLVMATATLRRFEAEGRLPEDLPLVDYALRFALSRIQEAFEEIHRNFGGALGGWLRTVGLFFVRLNPLAAPPDDVLSHRAALTIQSPSAQYHRLVRDVFLAAEDTAGAGRLLHAFRLLHAAAPAAAKVQAAQRARALPRGPVDRVLARAVDAGVITSAEAGVLRDATAARAKAIEVDTFTPEQFFQGAAREARPVSVEIAAARVAAA